MLLWKNKTLKIWDIKLFPKYRGKGLGTQLLNWLVDYAQKENMQEIWGWWFQKMNETLTEHWPGT